MISDGDSESSLGDATESINVVGDNGPVATSGRDPEDILRDFEDVV